MWSKIKQFMLPDSIRYRRITIALYVLFSAACLPLYFLGMLGGIVERVVYLTWRLNIFGVWKPTVPYYCEYYAGSVNRLVTGQCEFSNLSPSSDGAEPTLSYFMMYVIGGYISIRIACVCLQKAEEASGFDFLSRIITVFIPGVKRLDDRDGKA